MALTQTVILLGPLVLLLGIGTASTKGGVQKVFLGAQIAVFTVQIALFITMLLS